MFKVKGFICGTAFICLLLSCWHASLSADESPFPQFECVTPNVNFWIDIYGRYTSSQAVVHDSTDLNIIYDVIDIRPYEAPGSREINREIMDRVRTKYSAVLRRLADGGPAPDEAEASRVAALFGESADGPAFRRAAGNIRCQIGQKDRFLAGLIRSGAYMDQIIEIFRSYHLPEDLAYLPHVESSFNVRAYSKFGAAGLWQFMRSTGQRFMEIGYVLDERRDPIRATHAAARLLKENYSKLEDWPMALTAYNHGAAGMEKAKQLHGSYPEIFKKHHSRLFKFASRNFYSEFLAARHVARNYRDYFGDVAFDRPRAIQTVVLEGFCSFEKLRDHFALDTDELMELNPALRPPVFSGQKLIPRGYALNLPRYADDSQTPLIAVVPAALYQNTQMPSRFYTVQAGDTAGRIARRHGITLPALLTANNMTQRTVLHPRQTLRIPGAGEILLASKADGTTEKRSPKSAAAEASVVQPVMAGDTEARAVIAAAAEATVADAAAVVPEADLPITQIPPSEAVSEKPSLPPVIETAELEKPAAIETSAAVEEQPAVEKPPAAETTGQNGSQTEDELYPQPMLAAVIPIPSDAPSTVENILTAGETQPNFEIVAADMKVEEIGKQNGLPVGQIQLEIEETLGHIAEWAEVRTQKIRDLNHLRFGATVQLGQRVKIPLNKVSAQEFAEKRYEYHKRLQEDFFAVYRVGALQPYRVRRGDNYWILCRERFGVPMWLLKHCNPDVDLTQLTLQQTIMIPVIEKNTGDEPGIGAPDETEVDPVESDQSDGEMPEKNVSSQLPQPTS